MQSLRIGIPMIGGKHWHGGVLYTVNLAKALRCQKSPRPIILAVMTTEQVSNLPDNWDFIELCDKIVLIGDSSHFQSISDAPIPVMNFANLTEAQEVIDFFYPNTVGVQNEIPNASWIPDFQHHHLPEFFSTEELNWRTQSFAHIAEHARMLVLSSEDARADFCRFYPNAKAQTHVMHFRSHFFIPEENPWDILNSMGITEKFILCCNQFWAHKDHETLFRALGYLKRQGMPIFLVCTGAKTDYRNHDYYSSLTLLIEQLGLQNNIKIMGFIPRDQQIALMRCCAAMVQPSLFEGWSTVLEDARCLGVRIIASDLAVHIEQNLPAALYFERRNSEALSRVLAQHFEGFTTGPHIERERNAQILSESQLHQYGKNIVEIANRCLEIFSPQKVDNTHVFDTTLVMNSNDQYIENLLILQGKTLALKNSERAPLSNLQDAEFSVFSQFGEDGIIQYLIQELGITREESTFIEFGVQDYTESNTRFLLMNNNWNGLIFDGSKESMDYVRNQNFYWRHNLIAANAWINRDNINELIGDNGFSGNIGILSIDIDGNDYWVWEKIEIVNPLIVVVEWNSLFGSDHAISIPYDPNFQRAQAHYSHLFWGASISAFSHLAKRKGYSLLCSNTAGNNLFFVRNDRLGRLIPLDPSRAYIDSRFRESRDVYGRLNFLSGINRRLEILDMPIIDVTNGKNTTMRILGMSEL